MTDRRSVSKRFDRYEKWFLSRMGAPHSEKKIPAVVEHL